MKIHITHVAVVGASLLAGLSGQAQIQSTDTVSPPAILQELHRFQVMGTVLYIAAHPDDENNQLIAYLARGRHYRTAYLSMTRGDGGQNVLGPEFGDELGVIRTQELLAARHIDGGRQFFTRAIDFGYSKDYRETLRIWNRQEVLGDIVRVIREYRPDVLITRFSPEQRHTHGHHIASAVLALQAFKLAGDPKAYPDQLKDLKPWQPKRILWNSFGGRFGRVPGGETNEPTVRINVGGKDPVNGESFAEIAVHSRSMHKTQGFGNFRGYHGRGGPRYETFRLLDGVPATNDIMDGVNTTWSRVAGGANIGQMASETIAKFNPQDPAASVPALLAIKRRLKALSVDDPVVNEKRHLLDRIIQHCLGLTVQTTVSNAEVVPGEKFQMRHTAEVRSDVVPVRWVGVRYPALHARQTIGAGLFTNEPLSRVVTKTLPPDTQLSQPYWLREPHGVGTFRVDDSKLIGRPQNPPVFPIEEVFTVRGQTLVLPDQPVNESADPTKGQPRNLKAISPVWLKFGSTVELFAPGSVRQVTVRVTASRSRVAGELRLKMPAGWEVAPAKRAFRLAAAGDHRQFSFSVVAPSRPTTAAITAQAKVNGKVYENERVVIYYPHIPLQLLQPTSRLKAVCLNLAIRAHHIGYLPGAGDSVAQSLQDMGCKVTTLTDADLTPERLKPYDAVVIGVRAFNVRQDLASHTAGLFAYVKAGGTVIEQYNRPRRLQTDRLAPYELHLSSERVTDETAPVTFLAPHNPALNTPNKITSADFNGWIQERGIYYPDRWDKHFTPLIECGDPGETPLKGGLLVAKYGRGYFVYTGLVFFRQLPAGVPGAYRLFANLVSLGQ